MLGSRQELDRTKWWDEKNVTPHSGVQSPLSPRSLFPCVAGSPIPREFRSVGDSTDHDGGFVEKP